MKRLLFCLLAGVIFALLPLTACAPVLSPTETMTLFSERYNLPAGRIYLSQSEEYDDTYLSPARFDLLYARTDGTSDREDITDYALFLGTSLREVSEMGIFSCPDRDAALEVVGMLRGRIDTIGRINETDTAHTADAQIALFGTTVVYVVLPDNAAAIRVMERLLS